MACEDGKSFELHCLPFLCTSRDSREAFQTAADEVDKAWVCAGHKLPPRVTASRNLAHLQLLWHPVPRGAVGVRQGSN